MSEDFNPNKRSFNNKYLIIGMSVGVLVGAFFLLKKPDKSSVEPIQQEIGKIEIKENISPQESWRRQEGAEIEALRKELTNLKGTLKNAIPPPQNKTDERFNLEDFKPQGAPTPAPINNLATTTPIEQAKSPLVVFNVYGDGNPPPSANANSKENVKVWEPELKAFRQNEKSKNATSDSYSEFIPTNTFVEAKNLNGGDIPTGATAEKLAVPFVFQLTNLNNLPNRFTQDFRDCRVMASGYGQLSSERAIIRLEALSCVRKNGESFETKVKGYIVGEDGKFGLRGRAVSKQGALLYNSFIAGLAGGFGKSMEQNTGETSINSSGGVYRNLSASESSRIALAGGFGAASQTLSQFYLEEAKNLVPVLEVDAARSVHIVFTTGADVMSLE